MMQAQSDSTRRAPNVLLAGRISLTLCAYPPPRRPATVAPATVARVPGEALARDCGLRVDHVDMNMFDLVGGGRTSSLWNSGVGGGRSRRHRSRHPPRPRPSPAWPGTSLSLSTMCHPPRRRARTSRGACGRLVYAASFSGNHSRGSFSANHSR
jgi:hypothetical protein